jgi:hypothetical protein
MLLPGMPGGIVLVERVIAPSPRVVDVHIFILARSFETRVGRSTTMSSAYSAPPLLYSRTSFRTRDSLVVQFFYTSATLIMSYGQTASTLWGPILLTKVEKSDDALEVSLHTLPKQLLREFHHVFDEGNIQIQSRSGHAEPALLAIPTNQHAREDLVAIGPHIELEKDRLLNVFMDFACDLCKRIRDAGYWADYIDPCSGLPMLEKGNKVYSEVDGIECLLGYKSYNAGFCKILTHPMWSSAVYPATLFAKAPPQFVMSLLAEYSVHQGVLQITTAPIPHNVMSA